MQPLPAPGGPYAGPGTPTMPGHYRGIDVDSGEPVYVRTAAALAPTDADTVRRVRRAIVVARMAAVVDCPTVVQLVDYDDRTLDAHGFGDDYDVVTSAWQWGDRVLLDELVAADYDVAELAADVERSVGAALACLHAADLVHCDVAPNNIVRVAGIWKLADLDNVVRKGDPVSGLPPERYQLGGIGIGDPARRVMDEHGLRAVLARIGARPGHVNG